MIIVSGTAEELRIIRDALIHAGSRRKTYGLTPDLHQRLAETFNAAIDAETVDIDAAMSSGGPGREACASRLVGTAEAALKWNCTQRHAARLMRRKGAKRIGRDYVMLEGDL